VQEVLDLEPAQIEPAPKLGMRQRAEFITGMGKQGDGFIIMLDMDRIFSADELVQAQGLEDNASQPQAAA
jgi:purine-binding chemotaxis protein CheW